MALINERSNYFCLVDRCGERDVGDLDVYYTSNSRYPINEIHAVALAAGSSTHLYVKLAGYKQTLLRDDRKHPQGNTTHIHRHGIVPDSISLSPSSLTQLGSAPILRSRSIQFSCPFFIAMDNGLPPLSAPGSYATARRLSSAVKATFCIRQKMISIYINIVIFLSEIKTRIVIKVGAEIKTYK
ncbi:unnamed protein product [Trichogramma brassicae]|uniref:Uncharacterized protein n=1 Tax=Trichogramma brassicae TaxID=86971 RepID=A0A6H5I1I3_9HYME|nr:unnamed protein product [Trichogramma brassicae]